MEAAFPFLHSPFAQSIRSDRLILSGSSFLVTSLLHENRRTLLDRHSIASKLFVLFFSQMSSVWTIVLAFIALVFFSISATVHGDSASCCQGKWSQCFTICEDMDQCSECTEEKETCVGNCPGSCSLKSAASISSSSLRRAFVKVNNLKMHKFQRRLRKFVKRMNRRQIA